MEYGSVAYNARSGPGTENIHFVRVPSGLTGGPQKELVIREVLDGACDQSSVHPPSGLLDRPFRTHLLQVSDARPHPNVIDSIITGPIFPFGTRIVDGELQLAGRGLAVRVVLREPSGKSERLISGDRGEVMVCFLSHGGSILPFRTRRKLWIHVAWGLNS
jgi:hypothetical protein